MSKIIGQFAWLHALSYPLSDQVEAMILLEKLPKEMDTFAHHFNQKVEATHLTFTLNSEVLTVQVIKQAAIFHWQQTQTCKCSRANSSCKETAKKIFTVKHKDQDPAFVTQQHSTPLATSAPKDKNNQPLEHTKKHSKHASHWKKKKEMHYITSLTTTSIEDVCKLAHAPRVAHYGPPVLQHYCHLQPCLLHGGAALLQNNSDFGDMPTL